jgi:UTP-glucose-1-phosphate uridylyltransferase
LVTHASKNAIENHFDTSYELESTLEKRVKRQLLEEVQAICPKDVVIPKPPQDAGFSMSRSDRVQGMELQD